MKNEIDNKIEKTLQSIEGISRAETNSYLFEKIKLRMNTPLHEVSPGIKWSWIAACFLVLSINCGSAVYYFQKADKAQTETAYSSLGSELGFNTSYNY